MHDSDKVIQSIRRLWITFGKKVSTTTFWIAIVFVGVILISALLSISGNFLPKKIESKIMLHCDSSNKNLLDVLWDVSKYSEWRKEITNIKIAKKTDNKIIWREYYKNSYLDFEMIKNRKVLKVVVFSNKENFNSSNNQFDFEKASGFRAKINYDFKDENDGSFIKVKEQAYYDNKLLRVVASILKGRRIQNQMHALKSAFCQ